MSIDIFVPYLYVYQSLYWYECLSSIGIGMNHKPGIGIGISIDMNPSLVLVSVWWYRWNTTLRDYSCRQKIQFNNILVRIVRCRIAWTRLIPLYHLLIPLVISLYLLSDYLLTLSHLGFWILVITRGRGGGVIF